MSKTLLIGLTYIYLLISQAIDAHGQITVHNENFNAGIGTWTAVDETDPTDVWTATSGYMEINGFGGSNDIDWLISPPINMDLQTDEYFMFDYFDQNSGAFIELYYSTNYSGAGTPSAVTSATWTAIPLIVLDWATMSCTSPVFQRHPAIDVSAISGTGVYFAFKYTGTSTTSKLYRIDNVHIEAEYYGSLPSDVPTLVNCSALKDSLHNRIVIQPDLVRYTSSTLYDVWDALLHTDIRMNDAGTNLIVWDMFTDIPNGTGEFEFDHCGNRDNGSCPSGEGICYNREHSFPRSWWGGTTTLSDTINTDMHHIYPSDAAMNTAKNNYPPGIVITASTTGSNGFKTGTNTGYGCTSSNVFEPIDEYKGDYARTYFFIVTRYQHRMATWETINAFGNCFMDGLNYPSIEPAFLNMLLQWHENDPVSQKEIDRNNAVYAIQGNRNPYIDNPDWVTYVWGTSTGIPCSVVLLSVDIETFSAQPIDEKVDLDWTTASELNTDYFSIERSSNWKDFIEIDQVRAAGNSSQELSYAFRDENPYYGQSFYRLKIVDLDGQFEYSPVRSVKIINSLSVHPNPTTGKIYISGKNIQDFILFDPVGMNISGSTPYTQHGEQIELDLSTLPTGVYMLQVNNQVHKILKL